MKAMRDATSSPPTTTAPGRISLTRVAMGHERVRAPRLVLAGDERAQAQEAITLALATKPQFPAPG